MGWRDPPGFADKMRKRNVRALVVSAMNGEYPHFVEVHGRKSRRHIRRAWRREFGGVPTPEIVDVVKGGGRVRFKA